jgi:hypothetical protein
MWRAGAVILASRTLAKRVCCAGCTCSICDRRCSRPDRVSLSRPGVPSQQTTRPDAACSRRTTPVQASQAQHTKQDEIATLLCLACRRIWLGTRKLTEIGILVRTSVHLKRQRNPSSTHTTLLCAASAFHPTCVLLRTLPNWRV